MSTSEPSRGSSRGGRPDRRRRGGAKGGSAGAGAGGKGGAGGGGTRGKNDARGKGRGTRAKVNPRIQIGTLVAPTDVVERAQHSRLLEVDASSEPLTERLVAPWVDRTPENVVLDVRAHRLLTHHAAPIETIWPDVRDTLTPALRERRQLYADDLPARSLDAALDRFLASIDSVREFAKLGAVVFPFPSYFTPGPRALDYLEWLRGRSGDLPIAIELRHRDWVAGKQRDATLEFLSEHQLAYVCVDVPSGFDSSQPPLSVATTDTAFVRFHGRNSGAWERDVDAGDDKFSYDYKDVDLEPWKARLDKLAGAAKSVHVTFSGRTSEAASRNARLLVRVLSGEVTPEPRPAPSGPPRKGRPRPR
ncbi:MAG TPA: DUF72 domain-containing protein [Acidimicrobiia bacterium]